MQNSKDQTISIKTIKQMYFSDVLMQKCYMLISNWQYDLKGHLSRSLTQQWWIGFGQQRKKLRLEMHNTNWKNKNELLVFEYFFLALAKKHYMRRMAKWPLSDLRWEVCVLRWKEAFFKNKQAGKEYKDKTPTAPGHAWCPPNLGKQKCLAFFSRIIFWR